MGVTLGVFTRADGTEDHACTGPDQRDTPDSGVPPVSDGSDDPQLPAEDGPADPYQVRAKHLLNARTVPVIVGSIMLVLITVFYIGSFVDPVAYLRGLPVSIVDQDTGASVGRQHVDLGAQLQLLVRYAGRVR